MAERDELVKDVQVGIEAEAFLNTAVGKYLVSVAEQEIAAALEKLKTVDPMDTGTVRRLQSEVWRAESVQTWLAELIQAGWNAEVLIQQQNATD
jgi:hypothetical protein